MYHEGPLETWTTDLLRDMWSAIAEISLFMIFHESLLTCSQLPARVP